MKPKLIFRILLLSILVVVETAVFIQLGRANTTMLEESSRCLHRTDRMSAELFAFFKRNRSLNLVRWKNNGQVVELYFTREKIETYHINNPAERKSLEGKYGKLPPTDGWGSASS